MNIPQTVKANVQPDVSRWFVCKHHGYFEASEPRCVKCTIDPDEAMIKEEEQMNSHPDCNIVINQFAYDLVNEILQPTANRYEQTVKILQAFLDTLDDLGYIRIVQPNLPDLPDSPLRCPVCLKRQRNSPNDEACEYCTSQIEAEIDLDDL